MIEIVFLSYPLQAQIPVFGNMSQDIKLQAVKSLSTDDSCNVFCVSLENHWGTHVDCPAHFFRHGSGVCDYEADFWIFNNPQIISLEVEPGQIIALQDFKENILPTTDLLLIKSGWGKYRGNIEYSNANPGLSPQLGLWLRKNCPAIRAIGFDWISLSPFENKEIGRKAHQAFLDPDGEREPILIIEDMYFPADIHTLSEVWVAPLRIEGLDSAPCTIIGKIQK